MKKFFSFILVALLPMLANAYDAFIDGIYYNFSENEAEVTCLSAGYGVNGSAYVGAVSIPETVTYENTTYSVTSIGEWAFNECFELTSITIPESVTSIGKAAFQHCRGLFSVTIPNSVTAIGDWAFGQSGLTSVVIPNRVTTIGYRTFTSCSSLTSVTIGNSVTSIGSCAFDGCSSLTSVTIGNSVTSIGSGAFSGCSGLTSITIPESVTSIGSYAFSGCNGLTSITIPNSVTSIGSYAFSGCYFTSFINNSTLTSTNYWGAVLCDEETSEGLLIKSDTVVSCRLWATSVTIPESVTSIGDEAFCECSSLTSVTIPESVTSIGDAAFSGCSGLTSITIGSGVTSIGEDAFYGCSSLTAVHITDIAAWCNISFSSHTMGGSNPLEYAKHLYLNDEEIKDLAIPNSVTSIGYCAFVGCSGLTSVTIPESVTDISWDAFSGCSGLTAVHITDIAAWCNISFSDSWSNPLLYAKHLYLNDEEIKNLVIPNSVTSIGDFAFYGCSSLTSITIGSGVTSIGEDAFSGCSGLTSIKVEEGNINYDSRNDCNAIIKTETNPIEMTTLITGCMNTVIPNGVTYIGGSAFYGCSGLTSITIPESVRYIFDGAFEGCSGLTSIKVKEGNTNYDSRNDCNAIIGTASNSLITGCMNTVIPDGVTSIGKGAFCKCSGLTSVTIPNSVTSIGRSAFFDCSGLISVTIGSGVTSIDWYAFQDCSGLTSVIIPNSVTSIDYGAFSGCSGLTSVTIGSGMTSIRGFAFYGCSGLTDVYCLAEDVPETIWYAFESTPIEDATLHVPAASIDAYKATYPWSRFGNIVPLTDDEIDGVKDIEHSPLNIEHSEVAIYNLAGQKTVNGQSSMVNAILHRGINIIRYSDGTSKKVMVK